MNDGVTSEVAQDDRRSVDFSLLPISSKSFPRVIVNTILSSMGFVVLGCSFFVFGSLFDETLMFDESTTIGAMIGMSVAIGVVIFTVTMEAIGAGRKNRESEVKIPQFAGMNQFEYVAQADSVMYDNHFMSLGVGSEVQHVVKGPGFEIGEYIIEDVSSKFHHYGFIEITLENTVPHIILDSMLNEMSESSSVDFNDRIKIDIKKDQMVQLEGDFIDYFTAYVVEGYGRDALYILTPDLMSTLVDTAADYDIEFINNKLYFVSREVFRTKEQFQKAFTVIEKVSNKVNKRSRRYLDEHASIVDTPDKYLKRSSNLRYILCILVFGVGFFILLFSGIFPTN